MVDAYGMIDGKYIEDSSYDKEQPYLKRDPRFEASIFYNGKKWPGRAIETFQGGEDMKGTIYSKTGYYLSKFSEPTVVISGSQTNTYHCFPMIRYAEILLNYAEAMRKVKVYIFLNHYNILRHSFHPHIQFYVPLHERIQWLF